MKELHRRLQDVVTHQYDGSARAASLAAGLNPNAVFNMLGNPRHLPGVDTLDRMAEAYGWDLVDVVYWALDKPQARSEEDPRQTLARVLAKLLDSEEDRAIILRTVDRLVVRRGAGGGSSNA